MRLLIFLDGCIFDENGVITFADFVVLLSLAFLLLRDIYKSGR
jgi:hypothetical protein